MRKQRGVPENEPLLQNLFTRLELKPQGQFKLLMQEVVNLSG